MLVGPDGTGKTTVASEMIRQHGDPSQYLHFRPRISTPPDRKPTDGPPPAQKRHSPGPIPVGWLRLGLSLTVFWFGYLRWMRPARRHGTLIIGDRWVYGYVTQPVALGFGGPSWLARLACQIAPRPDLVVRLNAPSEVVAARKSDLTPDEITAEDELWETLPQVDLTVDARLDPTEIAANILRKLDWQMT